jgi:hypothetical protein
MLIVSYIHSRNNYTHGKEPGFIVQDDILNF